MHMATNANRPAAAGTTVRHVVRSVDDRAAAAALAARRSPPIHRTMYALSSLGDGGAVWFAAAAVESVRRHRTPGAAAVGFVHATAWLGIESALVNLVIKRVARRPRPEPLTRHEHRLRIPADTSFPSGHAASAATMAVLLGRGSPLAPAWTALALGIGASRVHVGLHHGSDVVAGWVVGAAIGLVGSRTAPGHRAPAAAPTGRRRTRRRDG
jgi:undecaprenyl-diphosphatase